MDARYLYQLMLVAGHPGGLAVTVMDEDTISPSNTAAVSTLTGSNCALKFLLPISLASVGLHSF